MDRIELERLRAEAGYIARATDLRLVVLHGSAVRDEERVPEDLDLAVLPEEPLDPVDVTNRFIRRLGTQEIDVTDLSRADPLVLMLVSRDGVLLHEAEPGLFACFCSLAVRRFADTRKFREMERRQIEDFLDRSVR